MSLLSSLILMTASSYAAPGSDLVTTLTAPAAVPVYDVGTYNINVMNLGPKKSGSITLVITLPTTATSPTNFIMGQVTYLDTRCSATGLTLTCTLSALSKNQSTNVTFDMWMPWSSAPLNVTAVASTYNETSSGNNTDTEAADLEYVNVPITATTDAINEHCTGTALTSFYACTLFPSSLSSHDSIFHDDGTISFPAEPDYGGEWTQDVDGHLSFFYTYIPDGSVVAEFEGDGVSASCFEGLTTFPGSSYVSPYEVCLY